MFPARRRAGCALIVAFVLLALASPPAMAGVEGKAVAVQSLAGGAKRIKYEIGYAPIVERPQRDGWFTRIRPDLTYLSGRVPGVEVIHLHHGVWVNMSRRPAPEPHDPQPDAGPDEGLDGLRGGLRAEGLARRARDAQCPPDLDGRPERQPLSGLQREEGVGRERPLHLSRRSSESISGRAEEERVEGGQAGRARRDRGPPAPGRPLYGPEGAPTREDGAAVPLEGEVLRARRRGLLGRGDDRYPARLACEAAEGGCALHERDL